MSDYGSFPPPPASPSAPAYGAWGTQGTPPPSYLVWAILSLLLCWPLAIASIVFSTQVNSRWAMGDLAGSQASSDNAKNFAIWSAIAWVIILVVIVVSRLALAGMSSLSVN